MLDYLLCQVIFDVVVLICMSNLVYKNRLLEKNQRKGFLISFMLVAFLSIVELLAAYADKADPKFIWANYGLNLIFFILAPLISLLFGNSLSTFKSKESKIALICYIAYVLFIIIQAPFQFVFSVDHLNVYSRGPGFPIFLVFFVSSKVYLVYTSYVMVRKFQNSNWFTVILLLIVFLTGSSIQIFRPDLHTSWACFTVTLIVAYLYFNELWTQIDAMTGLFSHHSYLARAKVLRLGESIVIMDCDKFKELNDTYGHAEGDKCLITIAKCIKEAYGHMGVCYRIGGDEFAVILFKDANVLELNRKFIELIMRERISYPLLPFISIGYATHNGLCDVNSVKDIADREMYLNKTNRKNLTIN